MKMIAMLLSVISLSYSLPSFADPQCPPGATNCANLPEPSGLALLGIGAGAALLALSRRKK